MRHAPALLLAIACIPAFGANDADSDAVPLVGFRTFNGKPLVELLHSYGIRIAASRAQPADLDRPAPDRSGATIHTITFSSGPTKKMPCRLNEWMKGDPLPQSDFEQRGTAFPKIDASKDDPLIYWAATGKCSKAYAY